MKKYNYWIEAPGFIFLILLILGIWIPEYRWRLISTSIVSLLIAIANQQTSKINNKPSQKTPHTKQEREK